MQSIFLCAPIKKCPVKYVVLIRAEMLLFVILKKTLKSHHLSGPGKVRVSPSGCLGRCRLGPCLVIYPEGVWYSYTSTDDLDTIIQTHLIDGKVCEAHLIPDE
jgi:(2Fe-2S) ferredoxin